MITEATVKRVKYPPERIPDSWYGTVPNLAEVTRKAAEAMDALKGFATEARKSAGEAGETMKDISRTAAAARRRIDQLAAKLIQDAEKISALMTTLNRFATKLEAGEGTVGKLVNDPKLYSGLVEATEQMTELLKEFRKLVEAWRHSGVELRLK